MLDNAFLFAARHSSRLRRFAFRQLFEFIARRSSRMVEWTHMNYGYTEDSYLDNMIPMAMHDEPERYCHQLYLRATRGVDIAGKDVVDISCGRGGGSSFLSRYLQPARLTGVDIAPSAVAFCRREHQSQSTKFIQGDAEDLPLFDESADVVINIEASFCYGNMARFLAEVRRVLRPDGYFLYADLRLSNEVEDLFAEMRDSGLCIEEVQDISRNVVSALRLDGERRRQWVAKTAPWFLARAMNTFAGTQGTRIPVMLADGRMRYFCMRLRKGPTAQEPAASLDAGKVASAE